MSKSAASEPLATWRERGFGGDDLRAALGFAPPRGKSLDVVIS